MRKKIYKLRQLSGTMRGDQISRGANVLRTQFIEDKVSKDPKISGAQLRSGTISVTACLYSLFIHQLPK